MTKTLLITGGAGFIGVNFVRYWREKHPADKIVVLDALTYAGNAASLNGVDGALLVQADIRDFDQNLKLMIEHSVDTVVHFAAESHVDRSIHGPDAFLDTNILGTHALLKAAKNAWLDPSGKWKPNVRFHHVSTDEVYGSLSASDPAFSETTPYAPNSPYSASKAASDHIVRAYHHTYGMPVTTSNCSNNYGPFQFPEKLIPLFMLNILHGKPLPIYGDGMNVRDWLFVHDHCLAIDLILQGGRLGEVYNVGGGEELPNMTVIDTLCAAFDERFARDTSLAKRFPDSPCAQGKRADSLKTYVKDRPGHDKRYAIDETKIRTELGYRAQHSFKEAMHQTIDWYLANETWWRAVLDGSYRDWIDKNYA
jgi:dTDP-glucose 4,6-dehydratase